MKTHACFLALILLLLALPSMAQLPDGDGDGVPDATDLCPAENASLFDVDGDGCIDATANTRHIEYWAQSDLPLQYVIHQNGAPILTDGSDFIAVQDGFSAWTTLAGVTMSAQYDGTTTQLEGDGLDGVNLVSFEDPDFVALYGSSVIAVGVTTSFLVPTNFNGADVRPGQIVDADMLFNPTRTFSTDTGGVGLDLSSVAVHEAGHLFGINHSAIETATMFPALPAGTGARSLETDDQLMAFMAHPEAASLATATQLEGNITDGATLSPIPGAAVFAISVATGDTSGCQFTLPDGSYNLVGMSPGDYYVSVHPLDGGAAIKGVTPTFINDLVDSTAVTLFVPEYWDAAESATDVSTDKSPVTLTGGATTTIDIITNVDAVAPTIADSEPEALAIGVRTDALILIEYDEAIDFNTAISRFHFDRMDLSGPVSLGGSLLNVSGGKVLVFQPSDPMQYDSTFRVRIDAGVEDQFGNATTAEFVTTFLTEEQPAVALSSILPVKGVVGSYVTLNGVGFEAGVAGNTVTFGGTPASIVSAAPNRIVVIAPEGIFGDVSVMVQARGEMSETILFTVLASFAPLKGQSFQAATLSGSPEVLEVLPDGNFAYLATTSGVSAVSLNVGALDYAQEADDISLTGGTEDLAISPDGRRVYAITRSPAALHVIDSDYVDLDSRSSLFNQVLDTVVIDGTPLGITVDPGGQRAYVSTGEGTILIYDVVRTVLGPVTQESLTLHRQVDQIVTAAPNLTGAITVDPSGDRLMVATSAGDLLIYSTALNAQGEHDLLATTSVGPDPQDVEIDPQGLRAYVSDATGIVSLVDFIAGAGLPDVSTGGSLRGLALSPTGAVAYVADRANDELSLIDLQSGSLTFRSVGGTVDTGSLPVDVAVSPDGFLSYVAERGSDRMAFVSVGFGPTVNSITPNRAKPGDVVVIQGEGFIPWVVDQSFSVGTPVPRFNGVAGTLIRSTGVELEAIVPAGFTGGSVQVQNSGGAVVVGVPDDPISNAIPLLLPTTYGSFSSFGARAEFTPSLGYDWGAVGVHNLVRANPRGDFVVIARDAGNELVLLDTNPSSDTFHQPLRILDPGFVSRDLAFTPDGRRAYVATGGTSPSIAILDMDRLSPTFGQTVGSVDFQISGDLPIVELEMMPGGEWLIGRTTIDQLPWISLQSDAVVDISEAVLDLNIKDIVAHPNGRTLYAVQAQGQGGFLHVVGADPDQTNYRLLETSIALANTPLAVAVARDGRECYVATANIVGLDPFRLQIFESVDPYLPALLGSIEVDVNGGSEFASIRISPNGEHLFVDTILELVEYDISGATPSLMQRHLINGVGQLLGYDLTPDGERLYSASWADTYPRVSTRFRSEIWSIGGKDQLGVAGEKLPVPMTVNIVNGDLSKAPYTQVFVEVSQGSGVLPNGTQFQVFETDSQGQISFDWALGSEITPEPAPATPTHELTFTFTVSIGGLITTTAAATALADPGTLPLTLAQVLPVDAATGISVNTAVQASFSRAVNPTSIGSASYYLRKQGESTPITVAYGYSDGNKKVSMTPLAPLDFSTVYEVVVTSDVQDLDGGALTDPETTLFTTKDPPALSISSVSPPGAVVGTTITLAGEGFDTSSPSANVVTFGGGASASVLSASVSSIQAVVPTGAVTGPITVVANGQTATSSSFAVLVATAEPLDEILATVDTGVTTQSMALTPDGLKAYSVSTETNSVLPLDLNTLVTGLPIAVGNTPVGIVINPAGTRAYVANFVSGTVSVIDLLTDTVSTTITGFISPFDIIMAPDGDNVYVIDAFDNTVNVIDTDDDSGTFHGVTTRLTTGDSTKGAAITPDGTKLYLGTNYGFLIFSLEAADFGVTTRLTTGDSTKGAAITPDGSLLILVTDLGDVLIIDISPGGNNQVITRLTTGDSTKGAAVSPDGGLLYIFQEDSDEILVYQIEVVGSVSVVESVDNLGVLTVRLALVDTITAGNDPQYVVFDPLGSGLTLVGNGGSTGGITLLNSSSTPFGTVDADLRVTPRTLNLDSKGRFITARLTLPAGFYVQNVDLETVTLQDVLEPDPDRVTIEDENQDGIDELVLKFCRSAFQDVMPEGEHVPVWLSGRIQPDDRFFVARDTIRTIRPTVTHPTGGEIFAYSEIVPITWESPEGVNVGSVDVDWSGNDGETWTPIVQGGPDTGEVLWQVPLAPTDLGRVLVTLYDNQGEDIGMGMSPGTFSLLESTVPVALRGVELSGDDGDGLLSWTAIASSDLRGFHILRAESADGPYARVTEGSIVGTEMGEGRHFEYRDTEIKGNRTYWYKLEEDRPGGGDFEHGPYALTMRVTNRLDQNFPNAFNPATTIRFAVANKGPVRLSVYNVAGRRVKVLVNGVLEPDVYSVKWTGKDENGAEVSSGIYLYRLEAVGYVSTKKMTLVR